MNKWVDSKHILLPSATKLRRLCFYRRVSVHRGVSAPGGAPRGCLLQGVSAPGGVCSRGCLLQGGVHPGRVCSRGVSALGGLLPGVSALHSPGRDGYCC